MKTKIYNYNLCAEGLGLFHSGSLVGGSVSLSPYGSRFHRFSHGTLNPSRSYSPLSISSVESFKFSLMFGCGSLPLLLG